MSSKLAPKSKQRSIPTPIRGSPNCPVTKTPAISLHHSVPARTQRSPPERRSLHLGLEKGLLGQKKEAFSCKYRRSDLGEKEN